MKKRNEKGSIVALTAVAMVSLLFASGLAIDISHFYTAASELQNAADASALAGASALNQTSQGITAAVDRAVLAMNKYEFNDANVSIGRGNVRFGVNLASLDGSGGMTEADAKNAPANVRFVKVNVPTKAINTFFVSMVIGPAMNMSRSAVAGQSSTNPGNNNICNPAPAALMESDQRDRDRLDLVDGTKCSNNYAFTPGCQYVIKKYDQNGHSKGRCREDGSVKPGNYIVIDQPNSGGGGGGKNTADLVERFANGLDCLTSCDLLPTNMEAPDDSVSAGMNSRFGSSNRISSDRAPADANVKKGITYQTYKTGTDALSPTTSTPGVPNRRVIIFPISDLNAYNPNSRDISISRYAAFFLLGEADEDGTMQVEYIDDTVVVGDGSYNPNLGCSGGPPNATVTVLYR